jgi:hypothetical protein
MTTTTDAIKMRGDTASRTFAIAYACQSICVQAYAVKITPEHTTEHHMAESLLAGAIADALVAVDELRTYLLALKGESA